MLAYMGVPNSAVYAATKAYELVKSEGLWQLIGIVGFVRKPGRDF